MRAIGAVLAEFLLMFKTPMKWLVFVVVLIWTSWSSYAEPVIGYMELWEQLDEQH